MEKRNIELASTMKMKHLIRPEENEQTGARLYPFGSSRLRHAKRVPVAWIVAWSVQANQLRTERLHEKLPREPDGAALLPMA